MTNTRKLALVAILSAISFVLMFFQMPLLPAADFLQIDFPILPILIGLVVLDLKSSFVILILRSVLKLLLHNQGPTTYIGLPMNILAVGMFVACFALIWKKKQTLATYLQAAILGTITSTLVMVVANYFYAIPMFATFGGFDIEKTIGVKNYLVGAVLPFNLIQGVIFAIVFFILYSAMRSILKKYEK